MKRLSTVILGNYRAESCLTCEIVLLKHSNCSILPTGHKLLGECKTWVLRIPWILWQKSGFVYWVSFLFILINLVSNITLRSSWTFVSNIQPVISGDKFAIVYYSTNINEITSRTWYRRLHPKTSFPITLGQACTCVPVSKGQAQVFCLQTLISMQPITPLSVYMCTSDDGKNFINKLVH